MRKVIQRIFNHLAKKSIHRNFPELIDELNQYRERSNTTGTQWITLWMSVRKIMAHKPAWILESGTGSSTLVLAAAVCKIREVDPSYRGMIVSMESIPEWHELALKILPDKYKHCVEIILGPREKYELAMFRGYIHSNIPIRDYSFILMDGPAFQDDRGIAFCADVFKIMEISNAPVIHGVCDGRASSVMVIQYLFGSHVARYWHGIYAANFSLPRINPIQLDLNTPKDFETSLFGKLNFIKLRNK